MAGRRKGLTVPRTGSKKLWAQPAPGLLSVHAHLVDAVQSLSDAGDELDRLRGGDEVDEETLEVLGTLLRQTEEVTWETMKYTSASSPRLAEGPTDPAWRRSRRNPKRHRPRAGRTRPYGFSAASGRNAMAAVKKWLEKNDLDMDTFVRTPAEHRAKGYDLPPGIDFVIVSEGPFYMLMNGYYDTPAAYALQEEFVELLDSFGLWYDQGDHITFWVMRK